MHPTKHDQKKYCLDRFIDALVEAGVAERPAQKKARPSPLDGLRSEYVAYLRDQRGLTEATIYHSVCFLKRFMAFRFGNTLGNILIGNAGANSLSGGDGADRYRLKS